MSDKELHLPSAAVSTMVGDIRAYGRKGLETGSLLLTRPGGPDVTVLAMAGDRGVTRKHGLFVLSSAALAPLFTFAEDTELQLRAQVHSHAGRAFLSRTDKSGNIRVPGFIAAVVPNFVSPSEDVGVWGWWTYASTGWAVLAPPAVSPVTVKTVIFDADGVHDY